ncbi:MAG: hypothetical protein JW708_06980, partial [Vallitaleaceae bacterium]|nr:hypothetical protein [Vallitaleaceae bacterium]
MRQKIRSNKKKEFFPLPEEYRNAVAVGGKVESLFYDVCDGQGDVSTKHLLIYLPPGYDELNQEKRYNVLYLMH